MSRLNPIAVQIPWSQSQSPHTTMSTTIVSIPKSREEFESQLETLLGGLEGRSPEEISDQVLAEHILKTSDDKVEGEVQVPSIVKTIFAAGKKLTIDKSSGAQPVFHGTTSDQWNGNSSGALASISQPTTVQFFGLDGVKIPYVPLVKFLVIFFYNTQSRKFAVYVGKAASGTLEYTSGQGTFTAI
ncbi:hypothetical protein C8Q78DRAFT_1078761 [Trametes maxima]|nr:hypothetical protein C8Q78DRAFT_1078761 [Trametes maxima]